MFTADGIKYIIWSTFGVKFILRKRSDMKKIKGGMKEHNLSPFRVFLSFAFQ